jgi:hypothetical protein
MSELICKECHYAKDCELPCAAFNNLYQLWKEQDHKDKTIRIRNLKRQLGIRDAEPSNELRYLATKIINRYPEFAFIKEFDIKIGYVISQQRKSGEKTTYADCRKIPDVYRAYLPYDFIITFYERNTGFLNENQLKVLMYHELKHVGIGMKGLKITPHDIEDFKDIISEYGMDWNSYGKELPDMLGGG